VVGFVNHLSSNEILLTVRECEKELMGITNENGKGMGIRLGETWDRE